MLFAKGAIRSRQRMGGNQGSIAKYPSVRLQRMINGGHRVMSMIYLVIPLLCRQGMRERKPISVDLEVSGLAAASWSIFNVSN